ncbi:BolA family protein [Propionivibrio limicola]|uniref:BolA family protein n=1 Tax=Propionivibrio limicola TaxID=167645 RepID=UPI0012908DB5|nr:BolA family protein [Propionivibrio limicola]
MMDSEQIKQIIADGLRCEVLHVEGEGEYFQALVVSAEFAGKNRVQRQQMVNNLLRTHFDSGALHSLSMKTITPGEWSVLRG